MDIDDKKLQVQNEEKPSKEHTELKTGTFNFPFQPYSIQLDLMKVAYDTFEASRFAILESPTGTGKSLSLICSAITWLKDFQYKEKLTIESKKSELENKIEQLKKEEEISSDWLSMQTKRRDLDKELSTIDVQLDKIIKFEQRVEARRHAKLHNIPLEEFYFNSPQKKSFNADESKDETQLLCSVEDKVELEDEDIEKKLKEFAEADHVRPKIYYASRTHSQLSQFINEIKKTKFSNLNIGPAVKVAPLASRANLCVNPEVLKLQEGNAINERCMELQRETKPEKRCSFMKAKQVHLLKEDILSSVQDIEDIVKRGKILGSCPYYAARMSVPEAEVVVLPYNNLLHHETRKASSLDLKDSVVIIDEAHNILETICSIHSSSITGQQLLGSHSILSRYFCKYHKRMTPRNAEVLQSIVECIASLLRYLDDPKTHITQYENPIKVKLDESITETKISAFNKKDDNLLPVREDLMIEVPKFMGAAKIERFNIFKIIDFFVRSQLARKLQGFYKQDPSLDLSLELSELSREEKKLDTVIEENVHTLKKRKFSNNRSLCDSKQTKELESGKTNLEFLKITNPDLTKGELHSNSYPVYTLVEFLKSLTNLAQDGKVIIDHIKGDIQNSSLKFLLLNPAIQFKQMIQEARSIILAGGTMKPFEEFIDLLFSPLGVEQERLTTFSCNHVVGKNQLYVATLSHGATSKLLELSYRTRTSMITIDEFGETLFNITSTVPGGMVCFLPSYDYEQLCFKRWKQIGVIAKIETKKQVFREPKQTSYLKKVLDEYSLVVEKGKTSGRGALLLCVVGGKMSEGINFNDDLGRCIVMMGLPYANIKSSELQQKMSYYDKTCKRNSSASNSLSCGQQYYENLCIKGINQSIGRAIRHKDDYAAIILLDRRYSAKISIRNSLPGWMSHCLIDSQRLDPVLQQLRQFFGETKKLNQQSSKS